MDHQPRVQLSLNSLLAGVAFNLDQLMGRGPTIALGAPVQVKADARWRGLPDGPFTIADIVGAHENAMLMLKDDRGTVFKWFRATDVTERDDAPVPTRAATSGEPSRRGVATNKEVQMSDVEQRLIARAQELVSEKRLDLSAAMKQAAAEDTAAASTYLEHFGAAPVRTEMYTEAVVINLRRQPNEGFVELVGRVRHERQIDLREAIRVVSQAYPALAKDYAARR